jgi:hypothetical protein
MVSAAVGATGLPGGVTVTAAGSANTDGSTATLITNVTHDVEYMVMCFYAGNTTGNEVNILADIMVDPAGGTTWETAPLIDDLLCGFTSAIANVTVPACWYHFPIWVKSGTSFGCRIRSSVASETVAANIFLLGGNANPGSWWCGTGVETIGINAASSAGTDHTAGNSDVFSSWTNFGSTLSKPCGALQWGVQGVTSATNALGYHFEFGVGSTRIGPPIYKAFTTAELGASVPWMPIFASHPTGTQFQVRGKCSGTAQAVDLGIYAVI